MLKSIHEQHARSRKLLFYYLDSSDFSGFKKLSKTLGAEVLISTRDDREGFEKKTLLHQASRLGHNELVTYLLEIGHAVDPMDSSNSGQTPLMEAVRMNFTETAVLLIEAGASLSTQDVNNENAMHYAARNGSSKLIQRIIKAADLSRDAIQNLMTSVDIKRRLPEDLASRSLAREVLTNYRQLGEHLTRRK